MRRFIIALMIAFSCVITSAYAEGLMLEYDGGVHPYNGGMYSLIVRNRPVYTEMKPIIFNDRALVPVREVCEAIGAQVNYSANTQTIEIIGDTSYIRMKINDNTAIVNGAKTAIPDNVVPKLISVEGGNAKTMVPVRFISEAIGLNVDFNQDMGAILVDSSGTELATVKPAATPEPTPVVTPAPVSTPAPTPVVTAEPTSRPEVKKTAMTAVECEMVESSKIAVTVKLDGEVSYTYFTLTSPNRLVVDFLNTQIKANETTYNINKGGINSVRLGENSEHTRVVIDMDKLVNYGFGKDGNDVIIYARAEMAINAATQSPTVSEPSATPAPTPTATKAPIKHTATEKYVVLDPGHGGNDPGAIGDLDGNTIRESDLTLSISKKVKAIIENAGYKVYMTRSTDEYKTLVERPAYANKLDAAVFVSIHINSAESKDAVGTEVFYAESNNDDSYGTTSSKLAKNILSRMIANMGSANRGVRTAEHAVTKRTNMPSALAEVGFISNETELANMTSEEYQQKTAQGIAEGILMTLDEINIFN